MRIDRLRDIIQVPPGFPVSGIYIEAALSDGRTILMHTLNTGGCIDITADCDTSIHVPTMPMVPMSLTCEYGFSGYAAIPGIQY